MCIYAYKPLYYMSIIRPEDSISSLTYSVIGWLSLFTRSSTDTTSALHMAPPTRLHYNYSYAHSLYRQKNKYIYIYICVHILPHVYI